MSMSPAKRAERIEQYAGGFERLEAALGQVPEEARRWRPGPGKWSAHEVVCHAADSEVNGAARIRYLMGENDPLIPDYDQDRWAVTFDYHSHPIERALQTIEAVRANTVPLLKKLPEAFWERRGTHTKSGHYTAETWLKVYSEHLEGHAKQILRNLAAWKEAGGNGGAGDRPGRP